MFESSWTTSAITVMCLLTPMAVKAQDLADRDAKEVTEYLLTDAALANLYPSRQPASRLIERPRRHAVLEDREREQKVLTRRHPGGLQRRFHARDSVHARRGVIEGFRGVFAVAILRQLAH